MESIKRKNDDQNQRSASLDQNQGNQQNKGRHSSQQEQQAGNNRHHGDNRQQEGGDKYNSHGYLNDNERYDDTEL